MTSSLQHKLTFDNRFVTQLTADLEPENFVRQVFDAAYSLAMPTPTAAPQLVAVSYDVAIACGFDCDDLAQPLFSKVFSGNGLLDGMTPYAMCYGGHQFGHWAGQLGDGRAINLGEVVTPTGHQTLQLKGAGPTPYSRTADGRAVLRSSVREFLCSEAMFHLGIPTTRALSLCLTGDEVVRDMFYDGRAAAEPGAVVCRVSSSFMRFGNFQLAAKRQDMALLKSLADFTIKHDFPHLLSDSTLIGPDVYIAWFKEVCQRTCELVIAWQCVGFVHGVMNTDNMSIIGETIDYGPYGWVDNFDLGWTPNTTDAQGKRYCFGRQGEIAQWNLFQLANAIYPLVDEAEPLEALLAEFATDYQQQWTHMMASKLGLVQYSAADLPLIEQLETLLMAIETDMTIFFRTLATLKQQQPVDEPQQLLQCFTPCYYNLEQVDELYLTQLAQWLTAYLERISTQNISDERRSAAMNKVNPKYVLRNYLAQQAITAAEQGDFSEIATLQTLLQFPYDEQPEFERYAQKRPDWARDKPGCSMLSCSS
ncbi:YdiU family protein [Alteromonadales bacterium alter-6D02]|nr:YdiU family protein [Alteromonadales bacterium alter-6D02]